MKEISIYAECYRPLWKALEIMSDDWVDEGNSCRETVITLRDAVKELLRENETLKLKIAEFIDGENGDK